jgi:hypothetical protein
LISIPYELGISLLPVISLTSNTPYPTCVSSACKTQRTPVAIEFFEGKAKDQVFAQNTFRLILI